MDTDRQLQLLTAGAVDVISPAELRTKLEAGQPLRVKLGIDPTASDIHLGFAVVLRKLRQFQDLGHRAILIIGDFTARVGDPSGRSATRPQLTAEQVDAHARTYLEQVSRILDFGEGAIEVHRNSTWLEALDMEAVLRLTSQVTVARLLERDDFSNRYQGGVAISLTEFLYPLLQGIDSVEVRADVELGGTDQLFNNLMGRHLQQQAGQRPQVVLTTPLLEGLSGGAKMSKSLGNYVGIADAPADQFGKLMSIPDALLPSYFRATTGMLPEELEAVLGDLAAGRMLPNVAKRLLARTVVDLYHGPEAGKTAEAEFDRVFKAHETPSDVSTFALGPEHLGGDGTVRLSRLLCLAGLVASNREAARKIAEGGVRVEGEVVAADRDLAPADVDGATIQVGRRKWARIASLEA